MRGSSEILAAIRDLQTHFEGQSHATNKGIQELHKSVDLWFDALQAGPLPARSGSHGSFQRPPGSAAPPPFLSFDVTSAAASTSIAAATISATPPPFLFGSSMFSDPQELMNQVQAKATPITTVLPSSQNTQPPPPPPFSPKIEARPTSAIPSPPTAPSASPSPTKTALVPPPATISPKLSPAHRRRCRFLVLLGTDDDEEGKLSDDLPAADLHQSMEFQLVLGGDLAEGNQGISFTQFQLLAHSTKVGQILENILWPSPLDMEAQSNPFNKYQDVAAMASRRRVIFSLYALEEVYKDIFESPP